MVKVQSTKTEFIPYSITVHINVMTREAELEILSDIKDYDKEWTFEGKDMKELMEQLKEEML